MRPLHLLDLPSLYASLTSLVLSNLSGAGTFIQTCTVTLNPIVVDGMDMVKQEKSCVVTPDNGNSDGPGARTCS